ncbi:MAG: FeoB-associated Cys-rich membrane protein [Porphyromonas sp.]|nr:FeoB-associated Cys-rich membrane protein [Porphyromonas sp.]
MEIIVGILIAVCLYYLVRYIIEKKYGSVQQFLISRLAKRFAERASQYAQDGERQRRSRGQQKAEPQKPKDSVSVIRDANMDKKNAEYAEYEEL